MKSESLAILTVLGKDQPGIIALVTQLLYKHSCNLEDISMTVLEGEFAMILIVCFPNQAAMRKVQTAIEKRSKKGDLTFFWKEVSRKMLKRGDAHPKGFVRYMVSAIGKDKTGIVYSISSILAREGFNIVDLNSRILGHGNKALYALLMEVDIPRSFNIRKLDQLLGKIRRKLDIEIHMKPIEKIEF